MKQNQHIGDNSNDNQQIQAHGDVNTSSATNGGVSFTGHNQGIVITSVPTSEEPEHTFDIPKKSRVPVPASIIGVVSGLITIAGFVTGGFSVKQLVDIMMAGAGLSAMSGPPPVFWWLIGSLLAIGFGLLGWTFFRFLRRNVLRLPKRWLFRAWAGIKEESGRTYPYSLRLAMRCPKCANQNLRFQQVPADGYDIVNLNTGARKKRVVTAWASTAVCPRNEQHSIPVDISGNDFDEAFSA